MHPRGVIVTNKIVSPDTVLGVSGVQKCSEICSWQGSISRPCCGTSHCSLRLSLLQLIVVVVIHGKVSLWLCKSLENTGNFLKFDFLATLYTLDGFQCRGESCLWVELCTLHCRYTYGQPVNGQADVFVQLAPSYARDTTVYPKIHHTATVSTKNWIFLSIDNFATVSGRNVRDV